MNKGLEAAEIARIKSLCEKQKRNFIYNDSEETNENSAYFYFVGKHEGKEVVFNAFMYTLEMEYISNLYEEAREMVLSWHPDWTDETIDSETEEVIDEMENALMELEEEEAIKVSEFYEFNEDTDYGVELDICLNITEVDEKAISKFINDFNAGKVKLDEVLYSFNFEEDAE